MKYANGLFLSFLAIMVFAGALGCGCGDDDDDDSGGGDDDTAADDDDGDDDDADDDDADDDDDDVDDDDDDVTPQCVDEDGDGHGADCSGGPDCDDADPDNWVSCDNCADADADGYYYGCDAYTEIDGPDCHDGDAAVWQLLAGYKDADGDTYPGTAHQICSGDGLPPGFAAESTDCDDTDFTIHPDAVDLPDDGIDQDCDDGDFTADDANGFFVDGATGDDGDAGTKAAPFETVQKGVDEADAVDGGTNVYISMGTYDEDVSGVSASLFGGYDASDGWSRDIDANTTTINGQTEYGVELVGVNGTTVAIDGLTVNGADSVAGTSAGVFLEGNNVLVSRNVLTGGDDSTASVGLLVSGVAPTWLTVVDNVIDTGTGATTTAAGFYGFIAGPSSFINNEIGSQDSSTGATYGAVLAPFAGSFLFHGNTFTAGDAGVGNSIAVYHLQQQPHSLWFENNEVMGGESTTGGSVGIYSIAGGHWNVVNNYVASTDALTSSIGGAFAYGGSLFADGNDFIVDGTATGTAIAFYSALKSTSFVTNNFADGGDADDISVGFALVSEDGSAVVSNNTFLGGSGDKSYGVYAAFDYNSFPPSVQFINNAVDAGTGTTSAVNVSDWSDANLGAWFMYNNNFSGASPDCIVYTDFDTGCETDIADVDECDWFNCGVAMGNLDETPGFVNPGSGNFHLLGTSNLIDAGINPLTVLGLPGNDTLFIDYDGENRPAGGGWDIGFDEVP